MAEKRGKHSREAVKSASSEERAKTTSAAAGAVGVTGATEEKASRFRRKKKPVDRNEAIFVLLRHKIVAAIMLVLAMLLAGIMTIIYTSSYMEVYQQDVSMLADYTQRELKLYQFPQPENKSPQYESVEPTDDDSLAANTFGESLTSQRYRLSTFYSVVLSADDEVVQVKNNANSIYTNQELGQMAQSMVQSSDLDGTRGDMVYLVTYFAGGENTGAFVAMLDNTVFKEISSTLLRYALIFGSICLIVFFLLANYLAKWMVRPLEESYMHQVRFISDAGHELKTPIAVVNANSELLERQIGENQWLSNIRYENQRMGDLVTKLLQLAHAEQDNPELIPLDLSRLVAGEVLPFESIVFEKGLNLQSSIENDIYIAGDKMQLQQLTSILLDNAISYAVPNSTISIALWQQRSNAVLEVGNYSDNISEEAGEHLFDRFYRADNARTGDGGHYGLGLSIAKAVTKTHKGNIEANVSNGYVTIRFTAPMA